MILHHKHPELIKLRISTDTILLDRVDHIPFIHLVKGAVLTALSSDKNRKVKSVIYVCNAWFDNRYDNLTYDVLVPSQYITEHGRLSYAQLRNLTTALESISVPETVCSRIPKSWSNLVVCDPIRTIKFFQKYPHLIK